MMLIDQLGNGSLPQDIQHIPPSDLRRFVPDMIRTDFGRLFKIADLQPSRPEYVQPFLVEDMPGELTHRANEYVSLNPEIEEVLLGLDTEEMVGKRVLHLGFGDSRLDTVLTKKGASNVLVDIDATAVNSAIAESRAAEVGNGENLRFEQESFDYVILKYILNVSENPKKILEEALRVCKTGGKVVIFPVMAFVDVEKTGFREFDWTRWGLDWFTLKIARNEDSDLQKVADFLTSGKFAVKPQSHWTTAARIYGHYYQNYSKDNH